MRGPVGERGTPRIKVIVKMQKKVVGGSVGVSSRGGRRVDVNWLLWKCKRKKAVVRLGGGGGGVESGVSCGCELVIVEMQKNVGVRSGWR